MTNMVDQFYLKAVRDRKQELAENSKWLNRILEHIKEVNPTAKSIRCLALGQVTDFLNPRFQLAMLLIIADYMKIDKITAWDPAFGKEDKLLLEHYNIEIVEKDPSETTDVLWYVPHAPMTLVREFPSRIGDNVYIGNDLRKFQIDEGDLLDYRSSVNITTIEPASSERYYAAFNALAIHSKR